jgi:hypothetical protein
MFVNEKYNNSFLGNFYFVLLFTTEFEETRSNALKGIEVTNILRSELRSKVGVHGHRNQLRFFFQV